MKIKPSVFGATKVELEDSDLAKIFDFVGSNTDEQKSAIGAVVSQLIDTAKTELDNPENVKAAANAMDFMITQGFASLMKVLEENPDFLQPFVEQVLPQVINKVGQTLQEMEDAPKAAISDFLGDVLRKARAKESIDAPAQMDQGLPTPSAS